MEKIAKEIIDNKKNITLIYAFNATGKTRLSVAYKDITKDQNDSKHSGVYYNAYSEDLFTWDNDDNVSLKIHGSSLNTLHSSLNESIISEKLKPYKPKYRFDLNWFENPERGIESIKFFLKKENEEEEEEDIQIKISRGEERIFVWCFFLALFDVEAWTGEGKQSDHFFIDDPVSSLDDHNIFVTVASVMNLIDQHYKNRKIIITTHHIGFFSIMAAWLSKGEKSDAYKEQLQGYILKKNKEGIKLVKPKNDVFLYHLELLQTLKKAIDEDEIYAFHFALLRQVLENISSFLGVGRFSYVLEQIGYEDVDEIAQLVNTMSHKNIFRYEAKKLVPDTEDTFKEVFERIQTKYKFILHTH